MESERQNLTGVKEIQKTIANSGINKKEVIDVTLQMFDKFNCEIDVYGREIQNYMILTSKRIIERETTALVRAFEINGKRIDCLIRP